MRKAILGLAVLALAGCASGYRASGYRTSYVPAHVDYVAPLPTPTPKPKYTCNGALIDYSLTPATLTHVYTDDAIVDRLDEINENLEEINDNLTTNAEN